MIKATVLGSGSKGNATFCEVGGVAILLDAGLNYKQLCLRLNAINKNIDSVKYIFVSHEHSDHVQALKQIVKKHPHIKIFMPGDKWSSFDAAHISVERFDLVHDVPCFGYSVSDFEGNKLIYVTDTDCIPEEALSKMFDCSIAIVEFNHDVPMLTESPYAVELQERVFQTHLRNEQARDLVECIDSDKLQHLVCFHLSENCNRPDLARYEATCGCCSNGGKCCVVVASQDEPLQTIVVI